MVLIGRDVTMLVSELGLVDSVDIKKYWNSVDISDEFGIDGK